MKAKYSGPPRMIESELKRNLGKGKFWFVGSCFDIFADEIPEEWIFRTVWHCLTYDNKYLFQSKNPKRFMDYIKNFPPESVLGTTIETNRYYPEMGNALHPGYRAAYMRELPISYERMLTVEPIFDFDLKPFVNAIKYCNPRWVNIGADSGGHHLPEPPKEKVLELIDELRKFTEVKIKKNLYRIIGKPK